MSHLVSILGQSLSYPAANTGAITVLALALLGRIVTPIAPSAIARELRVPDASPVGSPSCIP